MLIHNLHRKDLLSAATLLINVVHQSVVNCLVKTKCSVILRNRSTKLSKLPAFESCFAVTMLYTIVIYHLQEDWFCQQTEKS